VRINDIVQTLPEDAEINEDEEAHLFSLVEDSNDFKVTPTPKAVHANDRLWLVIRSLKPNGHVIQRNDIIKVGRVKFKVREFRTPTESFNIETDGEHEEFKEQIEL
jgi:hypothetical protein